MIVGWIICRDKANLDMEAAEQKLNKSLADNYYWGERESPYKNVIPRILAEEYMDDYEEESENYGKGLTDYKFFTFNKVPKILYVSRGLDDHATAQISFFDLKGHNFTTHAGLIGELKFVARRSNECILIAADSIRKIEKIWEQEF